MITNELNKARVADLHIAMTGYVERGDIPGIVTLIGRGDEIHVNAIGMQTVDGKEPMRRDTIFRIASITKPIARPQPCFWSTTADSGSTIPSSRGYPNLRIARCSVASTPHSTRQMPRAARLLCEICLRPSLVSAVSWRGRESILFSSS